MRVKLIGQSAEYYLLHDILAKFGYITKLAPFIGWNIPIPPPSTTTTSTSSSTTTSTTTVTPFDADYQAVLNRGTTLGYALPSSAQQIKQNTLVLSMKVSGVWALQDVFYVFATDGDSDFATLNWKSPSTFQATKINSPTFAANRGFTGNGTSSFIQTNYNPQSNGVNFLLNSASMTVWLYTLGNNIPLCGTIVTSNRLVPVNQTQAIRLNSGTASLNLAADLTGTGYKSGNRSSSTDVQVYKELTKSDRTAGSTTVANATFGVLAYGTSSTVFSTSEVSMFAAGGNMSEVQHNAFRNSFNTYITSL